MTPPEGLGPTQLDYPFPEAPAGGVVREVAPGILWLRMPLPFALDHINLWVLEDGDGWTLVDTGLNTPDIKALWEQLFATVLTARPVKRIVVTHFHPDHMGLAGWLCERTGAPLWATQGEWLHARMVSLDGGPDFDAAQAAFYRRTGLDAASSSALVGRGNAYASRVSPIPRSYTRIVPGATLTIGGRAWQVIIGRGHAPEHACLYCPELDVLISGDQVLPRISPNVSVWAQEPFSDPLGDFLESLERIAKAVPAHTFVLPSHRLPFRGLHLRIDELVRHHRERLEAVRLACAEPRTVFETVPFLFDRKLDLHQTIFAVGEALAHLRYLVARGDIEQSERADGAWLYRAV